MLLRLKFVWIVSTNSMGRATSLLSSNEIFQENRFIIIRSPLVSPGLKEKYSIYITKCDWHWPLLTWRFVLTAFHPSNSHRSKTIRQCKFSAIDQSLTVRSPSDGRSVTGRCCCLYFFLACSVPDTQCSKRISIGRSSYCLHYCFDSEKNSKGHKDDGDETDIEWAQINCCRLCQPVFGFISLRSLDLPHRNVLTIEDRQNGDKKEI